jgi:hypothetical protein
MNEFTHYATSSKRDLAKHLKKYKDRYNREQHIVCEYKSLRDLVPISVKTVRTFILEYNMTSVWHPKAIVQKFIGQVIGEGDAH